MDKLSKVQNSHSKLLPHSEQWDTLYKAEEEQIRNVIVEDLIDIQNIGSTAIPNIIAKPIIDIAVLLKSFDNIQTLIVKLLKIGYEYDQKRSSSERYFLIKGNPVRFHLSLTNPNVSYWKRQILFRDYLLNHQDKVREYEQLKLSLLQEDPTGKSGYIGKKRNFVEKILELAEKENKK